MKLPHISRSTIRQLLHPTNLSVYLFAIIAFSLTWSTAKVIQKNYSIQKDIAALEQENEVRELENQRLKYQITYYKSDAYLELEARRKLNKAGNGEKVIAFPRPTTADKPADSVDAGTLSDIGKKQQDEQDTSWAENLRAWRDFLLLRHNN
jgi:cell division protein FtsB